MQWTRSGSETTRPDQNNSSKTIISQHLCCFENAAPCLCWAQDQRVWSDCTALLVCLSDQHSEVAEACLIVWNSLLDVQHAVIWKAVQCELNSFPNTTNKSQPRVEMNITLSSAADIPLWRLITCPGPELLILWPCSNRTDPIVTPADTEKFTLQYLLKMPKKIQHKSESRHRLLGKWLLVFVYVFQNSFCVKHPDSVGQLLIGVHPFHKPRVWLINIIK